MKLPLCRRKCSPVAVAALAESEEALSTFITMLTGSGRSPAVVDLDPFGVVADGRRGVTAALLLHRNRILVGNEAAEGVARCCATDDACDFRNDGT